MPRLDRHSWGLFQDTEKIVCTLDYRLAAKIVLGELCEPLGRVLLFLFWYLRVNGSRKHVPFCLGKCATKSGHGFRAFGRDPIVLAVEGFGGIDVIFHDTEVPEVSDEKLKCTAAIR